MRKLFHLVAKEWLVLLRDWHALLLLFAMPVAFILVMSLALRDQFSAHRAASIRYWLLVLDTSEVGAKVAERLRAEANFRELESGAGESELAARVGRDEAHFLVVIPEGFGAAIDSPEHLAVRVTAGPGVEPAVRELFEVAVRGAVTRVYTEHAVARLSQRPGGAPSDAAPGPALDLDAADALVEVVSGAGASAAPERPSSVQQNVPAWLVFAMFFIALPLSTTWVQERHQGTFARLRAIGISGGMLLAGKLLPYYAINLVQVVLMLCVGVWVVPRLGGDALTLGDAPLALVAIALCVSFASVSYALLVANLVSTAEQATIFTGVSNLLLAVVGGIMVPRFIMPAAMQQISLCSPMAWGLEGFLDIFLRHGGLAEIRGEALRLGAFGLACLVAAGLRLARVQGK